MSGFLNRVILKPCVKEELDVFDFKCLKLSYQHVYTYIYI